MNHNFKVGDIVEVIDDSGMNDMMGVKAVVTGCDSSSWLHVRWLEDKGQCDGGYQYKRFKAVGGQVMKVSIITEKEISMDMEKMPYMVINLDNNFICGMFPDKISANAFLETFSCKSKFAVAKVID